MSHASNVCPASAPSDGPVHQQVVFRPFRGRSAAEAEQLQKRPLLDPRQHPDWRHKMSAFATTEAGKKEASNAACC